MAPLIVWDQVPLRDVLYRTDTLAFFDSDRRVVSWTEKSFPKDSFVFQWPYDSFPENSSSSRLRLHSSSLRWSVGAVPGTKQDNWYKKACTLVAKDLVVEVKDHGFRGLCLARDLALKTMNQKALDHFELALARHAKKLYVSPKNNFVIYDLDGKPTPISNYKVELSLGGNPEELLSGFSSVEKAEGRPFVWSDGPKSVLVLPLLSEGHHSLMFKAAALHALGDVQVMVRVNGRDLETLSLSSSEMTVRLELPLNILQSENIIEFSYDKTLQNSPQKTKVPDSRDLSVRFRPISWVSTASKRDGPP